MLEINPFAESRKPMSDSPANPARWWAGIFVGFVLTTLGTLFGVVLKHEGAIGRWDGRLDVIQHTLERLENKIDDFKGKR